MNPEECKDWQNNDPIQTDEEMQKVLEESEEYDESDNNEDEPVNRSPHAGRRYDPNAGGLLWTLKHL